MPTPRSSPSIAVVGAGVAGAACAAGLRQAGLQVTLFDKSRGVGGRMATRRARWIDGRGTEHGLAFDHGAQGFGAQHPRFKAMLTRAEAAGAVARWSPQVHADRPERFGAISHLAAPDMPALCRHLVAGLPAHLGQPVQRLQRSADGWQVVVADGLGSSRAWGHFDQVMVAMPPAQAALLLAGHEDAWADTLASLHMQPCWTLLALTTDVDWPWDASEPASGPLAWVARNDRKPGRDTPPGTAAWVAHAGPAWSAQHVEDDAITVETALKAALAGLLPSEMLPSDWLHTSVHRWRYALPADAPLDARECWWNAETGLGVCGDFMGRGGVEAAWRSGDELADTVASGLEAALEVSMDAAEEKARTQQEPEEA